MELVVYHFVSGEAFFSGAALLVIGAVVSAARPTARSLSLARVVGLVGLAFAALSATPFPMWVYAFWGGLVVGWTLAQVRTSRLRMGFCVSVALASLTLAACELPWHLGPVLSPTADERLYVIGDSISAGIGKGEKTWPLLLADRTGLQVNDLSRAGATALSAVHQAQQVEAGPAVVLLEIGGNDLLAGVPAEEFERRLEQLIEQLQDPKRTLVMFELPLPAFRNGYGAAQRRLARRHDAVLVPKRLFARVLSGRGSTFDGIHLSQKGHDEMATVVEALLARAHGHQR